MEVQQSDELAHDGIRTRCLARSPCLANLTSSVGEGRHPGSVDQGGSGRCTRCGTLALLDELSALGVTDTGVVAVLLQHSHFARAKVNDIPAA